MSLSRLEQHQKTNLLRQSILFSAISVGIAVAFLFLGLPLYIRVLALRHLGGTIKKSENFVPPARPFIDQPFTATTSATISLTGSSQAGVKIILLENGAPGQESTTNEQGTFSFSGVSLQSGENVFSVVAEDDNGQRSNPSSEVFISYITNAPTLEVSEPSDGITITQRRQNPVSVKGKTEAGNRVYLNDQMLFVRSDGSFSGSAQLSEGDNVLIVKSVNQAGIETAKEVKARYIP